MHILMHMDSCLCPLWPADDSLHSSMAQLQHPSYSCGWRIVCRLPHKRLLAQLQHPACLYQPAGDWLYGEWLLDMTGSETVFQMSHASSLGHATACQMQLVPAALIFHI